MTDLFDKDHTRTPLPETYELRLLARLSLKLGRTLRATYHEDGMEPESVAEHSVMLALVATSFAARYYPRLDLGLITQFALVHDLPEAYAGDTNTLRNLTPEQHDEKEYRESLAWQRIHRELGPLDWPSRTMERYEQKVTPEARFVWAVDKILPKITHVLNGGVTIREGGMSREQLAARYTTQGHELRAVAPEFPELYRFRADLLQLMGTHVQWPTKDLDAPREAPSAR